MMTVRAIFDVFSRRGKEDGPFSYSVPDTLRHRILLFCREVFTNSRSSYGGGDYTSQFWDEIHQMLLYRHGKVQLTGNGFPQSRAEDAIGFLLTCKDEEFLDFIEYILRAKCLFHIHMEENAIVAEINELFAAENAGYELTEMVKETVVEPVYIAPFSGQPMQTIRIIAYPTVIRKDDTVVHTTTIKPALQLLSDPKYKAANEEYLDALEDYKDGDYGDCLTKCCSAFESTMKILCTDKGWPHNQTDTASTLVGIVIRHANLDSFFEQPLMIIATLRNRLSKSHGAGPQPRVVSQNLARFALNSTAAAILFLVSETRSH